MATQPYGSVAHYWMIDGQNITQYDLPGFEGEAQSIVVHNSDVYVGGYYSRTDGMSGETILVIGKMELNMIIHLDMGIMEPQVSLLVQMVMFT